jgi:hypothetical protein
MCDLLPADSTQTEVHVPIGLDDPCNVNNYAPGAPLQGPPPNYGIIVGLPNVWWPGGYGGGSWCVGTTNDTPGELVYYNPFTAATGVPHLSYTASASLPYTPEGTNTIVPGSVATVSVNSTYGAGLPSRERMHRR